MTSIWSEISDPSSSTEQIHSTQGLPPTLAASSLAASRERRKKLQQPRQLLSCTKCRERKVKCGRTKPCSACCARGQPKECHFVVGEDGDYGPIQQSYELRKLRLENQRLKEENERLKEELQDLQQAFHGEKGSDSSLLRLKNSGGSKIAARQSNVKQRNFKGQDPSDSLYFGSPGLANIIQDFANLQVGSKSLTHTMPRGAEIYATHDRALYPFPTMWLAAYRNADGKSESCIPALLNCLPPRDELFGYLDAFQRRAQSCSFPHTPDKITRKEVERFLDDAEKNAFAHPDMLALIFAALAEGLQNGVYDKNGGKWVEGAMQTEADRGDMYIAAAMQALRMASFTNSPTLLSIQTLILIGPYLTNSGRFLDAWTLFGTTIRLAHSIGLHRNPRFLDPAPPLWWWMLHMDQQYSMTLGRPLGISGIGDCPPAEPLTTNPTILRLSEFINQFTVLARQILSNAALSNLKIDEFTDKLLSLWDTMPELLQFDEGWLEEGKVIPEWPLDALATVFYAKIHNYLILLNRQRVENTQNIQASQPSSPQPLNTYSFSLSTATPMPPPTRSRQEYSPPTITSSSHGAQLLQKLPRGRPLVLNSCRNLLHAFLFFHHRVPAALICWTMGQQAFNAAMILILDLLESANGDNSEPESPSRLDASLNATRDEDLSRVEQAYAVFVLLKQRGVHKLAGLAVQRISVGLLKLRNVYRPRQPQNMPPTSRSEGAHVSTQLPSTRTVPGARSSKGKEKAQTLFADTAMGNTGMFLLEDPGLQSFVPESFAPLSWDMAGSDLSVHSGPPSFVMPSAPAAPPDFHGPAYATGAPLPQGHPFPAYGAGQEAMFDMQQTNSTSYLGHEGVSSMGLAGYPGWAEEPTRWEASSAPHSPQQRPLNPRQRQRQQQRRSPDFVPGAGRRMG